MNFIWFSANQRQIQLVQVTVGLLHKKAQLSNQILTIYSNYVQARHDKHYHKLRLNSIMTAQQSTELGRFMNYFLHFYF